MCDWKMVAYQNITPILKIKSSSSLWEWKCSPKLIKLRQRDKIILVFESYLSHFVHFLSWYISYPKQAVNCVSVTNWWEITSLTISQGHLTVTVMRSGHSRWMSVPSVFWSFPVKSYYNRKIINNGLGMEGGQCYCKMAPSLWSKKLSLTSSLHCSDSVHCLLWITYLTNQLTGPYLT